VTTPDYTFHKHFDYGLLREDRMNFDRYDPKTGTWFRIQFDPFSASMSEITQVRAVELVAGGDLYAENVESAAASKEDRMNNVLRFYT
jgi:hypothetical protein